MRMFIVGDLSIPDQDAQSTIQQFNNSRAEAIRPFLDQTSVVFEQR
jgi:hypothetical protein